MFVRTLFYLHTFPWTSQFFLVYVSVLQPSPATKVFLGTGYTFIIIPGTQNLRQAQFGEGIGAVWLSNVMCTGMEKVLINCTSSSRIGSSCTHAQDVGVRCLPGNFDFRNHSF